MSKAVKLLAVAAIGFAAGVLLAPKSGKQTRDDLKRKMFDAKDFASDKAEQVKGAVVEGYNTVRSSAEEIGADVAEFAGQAESSLDELADEAKTRGKGAALKARATGRKVQRDAEKRLR